MAAKLVQAALVILVVIGLGWLWWPWATEQPTPAVASTGAPDGAASSAIVPARPEVLREAALPLPVGKSPTTVFGTVRVWPRTPLARAILQLFAGLPESAEAPLTATTSDENGRFSIALSPAWRPPFTLVVSAVNHTTETLKGVDPAQEVSIQLWEVVALFGRVRSAVDEVPLVGVKVVAGATEVITDAFGNYELLARRMRGQTGLRANHDGFADHSQNIRLHDLRRTRVDIVLQPTVPMSFEIVDALSSAPIAAAELRSSRYGPVLAKSNAAGMVQLPIAEGRELQLRVSADNHCPVDWRWRPSELAGRRLRIPLPLGVHLAGRVADSSGAPIADVGIRATYPDRPFGDIDLAATAEGFELPGTLQFDSGELQAKTETDGSYKLLLIPTALAFRVRASHADYMAAESATFVAEVPGAKVTLDLELAHGGTVYGSVQCNGEPRQGRVLWRVAGTDSYGGGMEIDPQGSYELCNVMPGTIDLLMREPLTGRIAQSKTVSVVAGARRQVDFVWHETTTRMSGRVASTGGQPMAGVVVTASSADKERPQLVWATTDDDGRFTIGVQPLATFTVRVRHDGIVRTRTGVSADATDVDFVWPDIGVLRLRLVDAVTQQSIEPRGDGVWGVAWRTSGDEAFESVRDCLDSTGLVQLKVPVGVVDVSLHLHKTGYSPKIAYGVPVIRVDDPGEVRVELRRGLRVELHLPRAEAFAAARADHLLFLLAESQLQQLRGPFSQQGGPSNHRINGINMWLGDPGLLDQMPAFNRDGTAELTGMASGRYRLVAFPDDLSFEPNEFFVDQGNNTITLDWHQRR